MHSIRVFDAQRLRFEKVALFAAGLQRVGEEGQQAVKEACGCHEVGLRIALC